MSTAHKQTQSAAGGFPSVQAEPEPVSRFTLRRPALHFEIFNLQSEGSWSWRLAMADGTIMAEAPRGYPDRRSCLESIERLRPAISAPIHGV